MFHEVWQLEFLSFSHQKYPSRSFKGIGTGAIRYNTYDFLLVFIYNYVFTLHH